MKLFRDLAIGLVAAFLLVGVATLWQHYHAKPDVTGVPVFQIVDSETGAPLSCGSLSAYESVTAQDGTTSFTGAGHVFDANKAGVIRIDLKPGDYATNFVCRDHGYPVLADGTEIHMGEDRQITITIRNPDDYSQEQNGLVQVKMTAMDLPSLRE